MIQRQSVAGVAVKNGTAFLARRKNKGALARKWEFPGGKCRTTEDHTTALKREFFEELGADIDVGRLISTGVFTNKNTAYTLYAYEITIRTRDMELNEHTTFKWVPLTELSAYDIAPSDMIIVKALQKQN